jgi:hypothetical protein
MHRFIVAALVALPLMVSAAQAGRFFSPILTVNPVSSTQFEVIEGHGQGPNGFWCAAANYAIKSLGKTSGRIYVATPRGPSVTVPGATGVVFSSEPVGSSGSASNSISVAGTNLLVNHAIQFCRDLFDDDRF